MRAAFFRADGRCSCRASFEKSRFSQRPGSVASRACRQERATGQRRPFTRCLAGASLDESAPSERLERSLEEAAEPTQRDTDAEAASLEFAVAMAKVASDTKAGEISVLHVAPLVYWTSYMVVVSVFSRPQLNAVLGKMEKEAAEVWNRHLSGEANGRSPWEVLDYGDVVVHIFTPETREFYDLEGFYGAAEEVDLPFVREEQSLQWARKM